MQAIVMAGGKGSRLHPYSALFPKPLMPLGEKPILEILLLRLRAAGVTEVILAVNHLRHLIEAFFGDGRRLGLRITYSVEDKPLGTAGPLGLLLDHLGDDFLLTNGDLLTTLDIGAMVTDHRTRAADATIGAYRRELRSEFGLLEVDDAMRMTGYHEKPTYQHLVSMGIYVLRRDAVRRWITPGEHLDMPTLMQSMQRAGQAVLCHTQDCFWLDIGRPEDFAAAQSRVESDPDAFLPRAVVE
ncbi:sugar phosphate nucleotidyltransferase [Plastoroseomonas hellenica]|uniref:sugar phosphate nucleotidyltransferase n=1 Tax=Plastoroseomonas hellenica TaxID=2687306 RepID=UPI001BA488D6|nr:sugar phosphate nucleotidyltransferase [Plastoroseomonas hellenica]MBR0641455.1 NTP transferase domain-containing protein [Plastoroseomonas hellenica]